MHLGLRGSLTMEVLDDTFIEFGMQCLDQIAWASVQRRRLLWTAMPLLSRIWAGSRPPPRQMLLHWLTFLATLPAHISRLTGSGRDCVKTRDGLVFEGVQTLPSTPIVDPELI